MFALLEKKENEEKSVLLVVADSKIVKKKIFLFLKKKLPNYMIPSEIIVKKKIKFNKNGKIDRLFYKRQIIN